MSEHTSLAAQAWNAWWNSVSTGANDKHMETAFISGFEAADQRCANGLQLVWRDGCPPKPWADEWFIAETTFKDRVCLRSLPDEYRYDFKTADETYIKADRIVRWMQFPDSQFIAPDERAADQRCAELEAENARLREALAELELCNENLAGQRSVRTYHSIIEDGSESLLLALDNARLKARQALESRNG